MDLTEPAGNGPFTPSPAIRAKNAFTLVEVIAAAAILMLGLAFTSRTFVRSMRQKSALSHRQSAQLLASSKMDEALAGAPPGSGTCSLNENIRWERELRESEVPGMLEVNVNVNWSSRGRENSYSLTSLVIDEGN